MKISEGQIRKEFYRQAKELGGIIFYTSAKLGWPDIILILNGTHWIEFKKPEGGKLSEGQIKVRDLILKRNGSYFLVDSHTSIETTLEAVCRYHPQ
jgi:hypothetical protein